MSRQPRVFTDRYVLLLSNHELIRLPKVSVAKTVTIAFWDILPELATCRFAAIANDISHNLAGAAAKGNPNPALVRFFDDERP